MPCNVNQLTVFAKYWLPGCVKTRLAADVGDVAAARLHRIFVDTTLARLGDIAERSVLCYSPPERRPEFEAALPPRWELMPQCLGDLGQRMEHAIETSLASGIDQVLIVGSDCPAVPDGYIRQAFDHLDQTNIVLGPSSDGGYYLVGAREKTPPIFSGIDWGTNHVWRQTVDRLDVAYATLPPYNDIDRLSDLVELRNQLLHHKGENDGPVLAQLFNAVEQTLRLASSSGSSTYCKGNRGQRQNG